MKTETLSVKRCTHGPVIWETSQELECNHSPLQTHSQMKCEWLAETYPIACFSSSLCTGTTKFPRKRLMMGLLLANLSLTSISKTSVGRDTKWNRCEYKKQKKSAQFYIDRLVLTAGITSFFFSLSIVFHSISLSLLPQGNLMVRNVTNMLLHSWPSQIIY